MIPNGRFKPYHSIYITSSRRQTAKQEFISEVTVLGRALTKTFIHIPFVVTPFGFMVSFGEWDLRERCSRHPSSKRYHE